MQRQIKFRVWNGTQMEYNVIAGALGTFYVQGMDEKDAASLSPFNTIYPEETPVMQFTGLTDKNGKEIYEGDILSDGKDSDNPIGVVYFYPPQFVVQTLNDVPFALAEGKVNMKQLNYTEVVGNKYENAELLETSETPSA